MTPGKPQANEYSAAATVTNTDVTVGMRARSATTLYVNFGFSHRHSYISSNILPFYFK